MKIISNAILVVLCGLFVSCTKWGNGENSRLTQKAKQLLEPMPDSALILLEAVNTAAFNDVENAEYFLLLIQAKDKAGKDISSDTAIFTVRDYFVAEKNDEKAALSSYYVGRVLEEQGNAHAAMQAYLEAAGQAHPLKNQDRLKGLIESHTGDLYYERIETTEAIVHYRKATEHFSMARDSVNEMYNWNAIGCSYLVNESFDSALYYFNKVTEMPEYHNNQKMQKTIMRNIGIISHYENNHQKARDLFLQALRRNTDEQLEVYLFICLSQAYHGLLLLDSATFYIERAMELCEQMPDPPMSSIYKTLTQIEESMDNYREALQYAQKQIDYLQNTYEKYLEQQLAEAKRKYNYEVELNKNNHLTIQRKNELIVFLIIVMVCLAVMLLLFTLSARLKKTIIRKEQKINTLTNEIDEHRTHVIFLEKEIEQNRETIQQMKSEKSAGMDEKNEGIDAEIKIREEHTRQLEEQFMLICSCMLKAHLEICKKYEFFKNGLNPGIHGKTIQLINKFFYGETGKINWETVDKLMPTLLEEKIKKKYDTLNTNEIRLCCLVLFDINKNDIVRILKIGKNSIATMTYRIRKKTGMEDIKMGLAHLLH